MRLFAAALLAGIPLLLSSCRESEDTRSALTSKAAEVIDLEAVEAAEILEGGNAAVLDVRSPAEFEAVHIAGAVLANIQELDFEAKVAELDQSRPYIVHCAAGVDGGRSRKAVEALKAAGAQTIYHLNGGINAWIEEELPVEKPNGE
ncbi:MAG: rhodanese-like domain-containing protein [Verrucomicrobiota bacterium]